MGDKLVQWQKLKEVQTGPLGPEENTAEGLKTQMLRLAKSCLSGSQFDVFQRVVIFNESFKDISEALKISTPAVSKAWHIGRQRVEKTWALSMTKVGR